MEVYEEISGVICNYNVSCDFFIDGLHSIGASAGEGRGWSTWSTWGTWSDGSSCASTGAGSTWSGRSARSSRSTCASTSKIVDARSD